MSLVVRGRRRPLRSSSLWSLLTSALVIDTPVRERAKTHARFVGDVLRAPAHGRAVAVNPDAGTLVIETVSYLSHIISAPVSGKVLRIEEINGILCNGVFVCDRHRQACIILHIMCTKSSQTVQLTIVAHPHGATSRIRLLVAPYMFVEAGRTLAYAGGAFETRLTLPPTSFIGIEPGTTVYGIQTVIGNVYRSI